MKGAYIFVLTLDSFVELQLSRTRWELNPGTYAYIGSGMGNLEKRVERHFSSDKRLRWHIDYLTCYGKPLFAILIPLCSKLWFCATLPGTFIYDISRSCFDSNRWCFNKASYYNKRCNGNSNLSNSSDSRAASTEPSNTWRYHRGYETHSQ